MSYNVATEFATITFGAPRDTFECFAQVGAPTSNVTARLDRGDSLVGGKGTSLFPLSLKKVGSCGVLVPSLPPIGEI